MPSRTAEANLGEPQACEEPAPLPHSVSKNPALDPYALLGPHFSLVTKHSSGTPDVTGLGLKIMYSQGANRLKFSRRETSVRARLQPCRQNLNQSGFSPERLNHGTHQFGTARSLVANLRQLRYLCSSVFQRFCFVIRRSASSLRKIADAAQRYNCPSCPQRNHRQCGAAARSVFSPDSWPAALAETS